MCNECEGPTFREKDVPIQMKPWTCICGVMCGICGYGCRKYRAHEGWHQCDCGHNWATYTASIGVVQPAVVDMSPHQPLGPECACDQCVGDDLAAGKICPVVYRHQQRAKRECLLCFTKHEWIRDAGVQYIFCNECLIIKCPDCGGGLSSNNVCKGTRCKCTWCYKTWLELGDYEHREWFKRKIEDKMEMMTSTCTRASDRRYHRAPYSAWTSDLYLTQTVLRNRK